MMKYKKYRIEVSTACDVGHEFKAMILEAYFPSENLFVNSKHCFVLSEKKARDRIRHVGAMEELETCPEGSSLANDNGIRNLAKAIRLRDGLHKIICKKIRIVGRFLTPMRPGSP
jgi:hypothetical protein